MRRDRRTSRSNGGGRRAADCGLEPYGPNRRHLSPDLPLSLRARQRAWTEPELRNARNPLQELTLPKRVSCSDLLSCRVARESKRVPVRVVVARPRLHLESPPRVLLDHTLPEVPGRLVGVDDSNLPHARRRTKHL